MQSHRTVSLSSTHPFQFTPWLLVALAGALTLLAGMTIGSAPAVAVVALALLLAAGVHFRHRLALPVHVTRRVAIVILAVAAAITVIRVLALSSYPEPFFVDEAWNLGFALSFVRDGHLSDLIMERSTGNPAYSLSWFFPLPGLWIGLTNPSYWNVRLFHFVVVNGALILFMVLAARNWFDNRTGWIVAVALFVSTIAVHNALIRHDGVVAAIIALSLWLHTEALKRERRSLHLLAGFAAGATILVHLHGIVFAPATLAGLYGPHLLAARGEQRRRYLADVVAFGVGVLAAFAAHYLFQYAPDPVSYGQFLNTRSMPGIQIHEIVTRILLHMALVMRYSLIEFYLLLAGVMSCLVRRRFVDLKLLAWFGLMYLAFAAVQTEIFTNYVRQMLPLFALMIGSLLSFGLQRRSGARRPFIARDLAVVAAALGLMLSVSFGPSLGHVLAGRPLHLPPPPATAWIREYLPSDVKILAPSHNYLWLSDYDFTSTYYLWTSQRQVIGGSAFADAERMSIADEVGPAIWDEVNADVVIFDTVDASAHMLPASLYNSGYLTSRGYELVYEWAGEWADKPYETRIYARDADGLLTERVAH